MGIVVLSHSFGVLYVTVPKNPNRTSPSEISRSADCLSVLASLAATPEHFWRQKKKNIIWRISHFHFSDLFSFCLRLFNLDPVIQVRTEKSGNESMFFSPCTSRRSTATISAWSEMDSMALKLKCSLKTKQYFDCGSVMFNFFQPKAIILLTGCWK